MCDLKLFASNSRNNQLPNLWCFCKINMDPVLIDIDDQHVSFRISHNGSNFGFSVVYASTNYISRRNIWSRLSTITIANIT